MKFTLSWVDILKLSMPLAGSLVIVWVRIWFSTWRERRRKRDGLWQILIQDSESLASAIEQLDKIAQAYANGRPRSASAIVPSVVPNLIDHLAELDPSHAKLYVNLSGRIELFNRGYERLDQLTRDFANRDETANVTLVIAIWNQTQAMKQDLVNLAISQLELMKAYNKLSIRKFGQDKIEKAIRSIEDSKDAAAPRPYQSPSTSQKPSGS